MVHSGSSSPMKTTPSASPHLTAPAPLAPPPGDSTDQDRTQSPVKFHSADLISNLDLSQPTADAELPVDTDSRSAASWSSAAPSPSQAAINGRTSGRKRVPKACDCCGPNSRGHHIRTSGRGRARGRGRHRGAGSDLGDAAARKVGDQLTHAEDEEDRQEAELQPTGGAAEASSQAAAAAPPDSASLQDGPMRSHVAPEDLQQKEDASMEGEQGGGAAGWRTAFFRGRGGGGAWSDMEVEGGTNRARFSLVSLKTYGRPRSVFMQRPRPNVEHKDPGNGDTVDLSDTEEEATKVNGLISVSQHSGPGSRSASPQDLDMLLDPDNSDPDSVPVTNGNLSADEDQGSAPMDVEASQRAAAPPCHGPVAVATPQHSGALKDHRLYCQPGTWEMEETQDGGQTDGEESLEQLTDLIHEFLESFYVKYGGFVPLSEADVLEHLKKKNSDLSNKGLDIRGTVTRYRAGLASAPVAGFMVTYNKHTLSLEDLSTLEEQNWLNDQIINMYGELIMEATQHKVHFFNSFFHKQLVAKGYDGVKRWTKKVDLFSKWLLLIPIHLEIHWSLVTVTMATKTISYYDSQGIVFRHTTDNIMKYLLSEAREKKQTAFQKGWKITIIKGIPQQKNDSDCGVFVLEYCRCLSVKQPLLFSQDDMPRIRKRIYKELCDCRLND